MARTRLRRHAITLLKLLASVALVAFALRDVDLGEAWRLAVEVHPAGIAGAFLALVAKETFGVMRWQVVLRVLGGSLRWRRAISIFLLGVFFNQALPSSIGGDAVRIWKTRQAGLGVGLATMSTLLERMAGLIALLVMVGAAIPWLWQWSGDLTAVLSFAAISAGALVVVVVALATMHDARRVFLRIGPVAAVGGLALCFHGAQVMLAFSLARGLGLPLGVGEAFVLIPVVFMAMNAPVSIGGWGVREVAMITSLGLIGIGQAEAVVVSILFGLAHVVAGLFSGAAWLALREREEPDATQSMDVAVGVVGAGAIGSTLALGLARTGASVVLLGRPRHVEGRDRLRVQTADGTELAPPPNLRITDRVEDLSGCEICLVAVKAGDTAAVARSLEGVLPADALVISLQNGLHNAERLQSALACPVSAGVVAFNVVHDGEHRLHQTSRGPIYVGDQLGEAGERLRWLRDRFGEVGQEIEMRSDIQGVIAAKLLINLNNGIGAATGFGIADALRSSEARRCFARCVREGNRAFWANGIRPDWIYGVPASALGWMLSLPNAVVLPLARRLTRIDPAARSSMLQDLERGRPTEIDEINGEIVRLAREAGLTAPANAVVVEAVRRHERRVARGERPEFVSPAALRALIEPSNGNAHGGSAPTRTGPSTSRST